MGRATQDVSIWDETSDNSAMIDNVGDIHTKSKIWDGTNEVTVITDVDNVVRLAVEQNPHKKVTQPVNQYSTFEVSNTKASYTVPSGKVLYVTYAFVAYGDEPSGRLSLEIQADGTGFGGWLIDVDATSNGTLNPPIETPFGPFSAGTTIRIQRLGGDNDDWSGGWNGYLEDI